jgi:hypothetical protein
MITTKTMRLVVSCVKIPPFKYIVLSLQKEVNFEAKNAAPTD